MYIVIITSIFILSVVLCHFIARKKDLNTVYWVVMSAAFGPLAIPFILMAKPDRKN